VETLRSLISLRPDVRSALAAGRPVIALESTIIAHGMPYPRIVETALKAEAEATVGGVVAATIGILDGRICVGLTHDQIERLGHAGDVLKVSRRDLAFALAGKHPGATTVCATMLAAHLAGLQVFATGGIGGVHRGAGDSFDVSADLLELSRTPVVVVSAGAKAILDLAKTLEYLETQGVPVVGYRTRRFPAFYSVDSGLELDCAVDSPEEIASLMRTQRALGLSQGILVANPVPREHEIPREKMERSIEQALRDMAARGISGKAVTPYLLSRVVELSGGAALETNVRLLLSNVHLACGIARALSPRGDGASVV
jgi:pseudouridine-5'-phosphate glycosidase